MARITVEDCLDNVDNRFELVLLATKRARELELGAEAKVKLENDKHTVVALREIAEGYLIQGHYDVDPTGADAAEGVEEFVVDQNVEPSE